MIAEFKTFATRGNVVDMAVGIILGIAFGAIAQSLVADVLMPPIGLALGGADFTDLFVVLSEGATPGPYASLAEAQQAGAVTLNYGAFLNTIVRFLVVAIAMFVLVRGINRLERTESESETMPVEATSKTCPYCRSEVPTDATRCPACTSMLPD